MKALKILPLNADLRRYCIFLVPLNIMFPISIPSCITKIMKELDKLTGDSSGVLGMVDTLGLVSRYGEPRFGLDSE